MAILKIKNDQGIFEDVPAMRGYSAYQLAVKNGFTGTMEEWLASLKGEPGSLASGDAKDLTVTFTESLNMNNVGTGDKLSVLFGKIMKWFNTIKTVALTGNYNDLINKPSSLPASDVSSWAKEPNKPTYNKSEVGLSNVDNTSDVNKPISNATKTYVDNAIGAIPTPDVSGQINTHNTSNTSHSDIRTLIGTKENSFSKNTAFNKNFGNASGTICEGNDSRLSDARPASDVSTWAKALVKPTYTASEVGALSSEYIDIDWFMNPQTGEFYPTISDANLALLNKRFNDKVSLFRFQADGYINCCIDKGSNYRISANFDTIERGVLYNGSILIDIDITTKAIVGSITQTVKPIITGDGSKYLADDGTYKTVSVGSEVKILNSSIFMNDSEISVGTMTDSNYAVFLDFINSSGSSIRINHLNTIVPVSVEGELNNYTLNFSYSIYNPMVKVTVSRAYLIQVNNKAVTVDYQDLRHPLVDSNLLDYCLRGDGNYAEVCLNGDILFYNADLTEKTVISSLDYIRIADAYKNKITSVRLPFGSFSVTFPCAIMKYGESYAIYASMTYSANNVLNTVNRSILIAEDYSISIISDEKAVGQVNSDWNATSGKAQILNKPTSLPANGGNADTVGSVPISMLFRNKQNSGYPGFDSNTMGFESGFSYNVNCPHMGVVYSLLNGGYGLQLQGNYGLGYYFKVSARTRNGDDNTWSEWRELAFTDSTVAAANQISGVNTLTSLSNIPTDKYTCVFDYSANNPQAISLANKANIELGKELVLLISNSTSSPLVQPIPTTNGYHCEDSTCTIPTYGTLEMSFKNMPGNVICITYKTWG